MGALMAFHHKSIYPRFLRPLDRSVELWEGLYKGNNELHFRLCLFIFVM